MNPRSPVSLSIPQSIINDWYTWWKSKKKKSFLKSTTFREFITIVHKMFNFHIRDCSSVSFVLKHSIVLYVFSILNENVVSDVFMSTSQFQESKYSICKDVLSSGMPVFCKEYICIPLIFPSCLDKYMIFGSCIFTLSDPSHPTIKQATKLWEIFGAEFITHTYMLHLQFQIDIAKNIVIDSFPNNKHIEVMNESIRMTLAPYNPKLTEQHVMAVTQHPEVTILFTDICNYTKMCAENHMKTLVKLSGFYDAIDKLIEIHDLQKIETIGDCCMVASGLKNEENNIVQVIKFAEALIEISKKHHIQIRVGISSGPVVSGVMGRMRVRYFVFGDTVNTASRMESSSVPYGIKISSFSLDRLYALEKDGKGQNWKWEQVTHLVKGKGIMKSYYLRYQKLCPDCQKIFKIISNLKFFENHSKSEIELLLSVVENLMYNAPYHNISHIFDTINFIFSLYDSFSSFPSVSTVFEYAIISMLFHDIGHPGSLKKDHLKEFLENNSFSTLEEFHANIGWDLLNNYKVDVEKDIVRKTIEATCLETHDIHMNQICQLTPLTSKTTFSIDYVILLCKCADFSHFTLTKNFHVEKSCSLYHELDDVDLHNIPASYVKDIAKRQVDFIEVFVIPLFHECFRVCECSFIKECINHIQKNLSHWRRMTLACNTMSKSAFSEIMHRTDK